MKNPHRALHLCGLKPVDKPHGRLGGPQTRNLNRRSGHCRGQPSFRLISSGSLCPLGNGPQGHRFPPSTSKGNPAPATCAVGPEALRSKGSLQGSPAAPQAQVNPVSSEKIAAGELFRRPEAIPGSVAGYRLFFWGNATLRCIDSRIGLFTIRTERYTLSKKEDCEVLQWQSAIEFNFIESAAI